MTINILSYYDYNEEKYKKKLKEIYEDINIFHTPNLEDMNKLIEKANILITLKFSDELLNKAKNLEWIQGVGVGVDNFLTPQFKANEKVILTNARGMHGIQVSEHAFALLLALTRRVYKCYGEDNILKNWNRIEPRELYNLKAGVLGTGTVGQEIANKANSFGMEVRGLDIKPSFYSSMDNIYLYNEIDDFFSGIDVLFVCAPLTKKTEGIVNYNRIKLMNNNSYVINIARGPLVVEEDLIKALKEGHLAGAGLDVFNEEPLPTDSKLLETPNVVLTPHLAGLTTKYKDRLFEIFLQNFRNWISQKALINVIDK